MGVDDPTVADGAAASMSATELADLSGRILRGRYQISRLVGAGSMGDVYEGVDLEHGSRIAIKVLKPERAVREVFRHRFLREAKSAVLIDHPNVVDVFDYGETPDGLLFIAMEFLEGDDLSSCLEQAGRLAWPHCAMVLQQVGAALAAAHDRGVVHRDVKPSNILLRGTGAGTGPIVKLVDFGVAKLNNHMVSRVLTRAADVVGTVMYMSPEQAEGRAADLRSDVYAFGVTAFQMVTGEVPFPGNDLFKVMSAHLNEPAPDPATRVPGLPAWASAFILRCLEKKPEDRYQSMHDVLSILAGKNEPDMVSRPRPNTPITEPGQVRDPHPPLADDSRPLVAGNAGDASRSLDPAAPTVAGASFDANTGMLAPPPVDDFDDEAPTAYYQAPAAQASATKKPTARHKDTPLGTPAFTPPTRRPSRRTQAVPIVAEPQPHSPTSDSAPTVPARPVSAPSISAPSMSAASTPAPSESAPFPAPPMAASSHGELTQRASYAAIPLDDELDIDAPKSSKLLYVCLILAVIIVAGALVLVLAPV